MNISAKHIFPTSTYSIEDKCTLKIGEQQYETLFTYTIYIGQGKTSVYDVSIERSNLKTGNQKIDTKFLRIANQYMEALFPLQCKIKEYRLFVVNISEIQKRIQETDKKMLDIYNGEGLEYIRTQFFDVTNTEEKLRKFIKQLHLMKVLSVTMQKFEQREIYQLQWDFLPIGSSIWRGEMTYGKKLNRLIYEPKIQDAQEVMNRIIHYIHKHDYSIDLDQENVPLFADFYHKTEYTGKTGRIKNSETNICIDVENVFLYEQKITLKNI